MDYQGINRYKQKVLYLLIEKYENSQSFRTGIPSKQRPQLTIAGSELAKDYDDEMDYRKREWIHAALNELNGESIIELGWAKRKENVEVHKIYLNLEAIDRAYQISGLTPKINKITEIGHILSPLASHKWEWVRTWWKETDTRLKERKPAGLDLDDATGYKNLVQVLLALPELDDSTPKRVFSQNLFHDSKHFEQKVERRLLNLLHKIYPEELEKDEDYLDQVGIVDNPKVTLVSGPIVLTPDVDLSIFSGGIGLSVETIKDLSIQDIPARTILLVENLTTYHEVIREYRRESAQKVMGDAEVLSAPVLVIYTGGFPHKSTQLLFRKIGDFIVESKVEAIYHWGDIDYGGIRIFEYIKKNFFPSLKPYRMDIRTYRNYVDRGLPFGEELAAKLKRLLFEPSYVDWYPVIEELLQHRKRVEQESMSFR